VELSPGPLAAGHYFLLVSGTVLSNSARYTGSATVSAVPEPATYGMLGGLGLVGAWHAASKKPDAA
jgi:hypothetical protein